MYIFLLLRCLLLILCIVTMCINKNWCFGGSCDTYQTGLSRDLQIHTLLPLIMFKYCINVCGSNKWNSDTGRRSLRWRRSRTTHTSSCPIISRHASTRGETSVSSPPRGRTTQINWVHFFVSYIIMLLVERHLLFMCTTVMDTLQ